MDYFSIIVSFGFVIRLMGHGLLHRRLLLGHYVIFFGLCVSQFCYDFFRYRYFVSSNFVHLSFQICLTYFGD